MLVCTKCNHRTSECACTEDEKREWQERMHEEYRESVERYNCILFHEADKPKVIKVERDRLERAEKHYYEATYEDYYSVEIDDDFVDTIIELRKKGYDTKFCCSGHPEQDNLTMYIVFQPYVFFDFTDSHFSEEWKFTRDVLEFRYTVKRRKELQKAGIDEVEYFLEQRKFLEEWAKNLPKARRKKYRSEKNIGVQPYGRIM